MYTDTVGLLYHLKEYSQDEIDSFMEVKFCKKDDSEDKEVVESENVTFTMALCSAKYRKLTLLAIALAAIQQLTGINLVVSYLSPFFHEIGMNAHFGSIMYAIASIIGAILSSFFYNLSFMNDRRGYIVGFALLSIAMACLSLSIHIESNTATLVTVMVYQFILQITVTPLYWFYMPAVTQGATMSISLFTTYFLTIVLTSAGPYILEDSKLD